MAWKSFHTAVRNLDDATEGILLFSAISTFTCLLCVLRACAFFLHFLRVMCLRSERTAPLHYSQTR